MAINGSDYIQSQILDESLKSNDHLSAMRELLVKIEKNGNTGGGGNGPGPGPRPPRRDDPAGGSYSKVFKDLFGEMKNISGTILGNNGSIQNTVGSFANGAKVVGNALGMIPGPVGKAAQAFTKIVEVAAAVYDYLNDQLNMYNQLNSAGLQLTDGMLTVRKGAANAFLSINEYSKVLEKNSDALAAMSGQYGDGVEHFGALLNTVQLAQKQMGLYGVSQSQLADITAKNYKFQKMYSGQSQLRSMNESQSTEKFVGTMTYLSKSVGKSVDALMAKFDDMSSNLDTGLAQDALTNMYGLSEDKASDVTKSMNAIFSSMGEAGQTLQKLNSSKLQTNALPEEFNNQFTQMYTDRIKELQVAGITDEKQLRKYMSQYVKEHQSQLDEEIRYQNLAGNTTAAAWLNQLRNVEKLVNDPKNQPSPLIENFTNRFNLWIGETFTKPFNDFYARTTESAVRYLSDLADKSDNAWDFMGNLIADAFKNFSTSILGPFGALVELPGKLLTIIFGDSYTKVQEEFSNLMGDIVQIPIKLGHLIWDMFTGGDVDSSGKELANSIKGVFSGVTNVFTKIGDLDFNYDDMKSRITSAFDAMKTKLGSWWDTAKGWFSDDPKPSEPPKPTAKAKTPVTSNEVKTAGRQQVTSPPEFTKPGKVEEPEEPQSTASNAMPQTDPSQDAILRALNGILNTLQTQTAANSQTGIILRQIADNTEPARNV